MGYLNIFASYPPQTLTYPDGGSSVSWVLYLLLVVLSILVAGVSFWLAVWYMRHKQIKKDYSYLELAVQQRTDSLYTSSQRLRIINDEMDRFMYHTSHDFRRPLSTIMGLVEVAKISVSDRNALELFGQINQTAINLDSMLKKLLLLHEINLLTEEQELADAPGIFAKLSQALANDLKQHPVELRTSHIGDSSFVFYPHLLTQLILNVAENAILFYDPSEKSPQVNIELLNEGGKLVVTVSDNGVGIPNDMEVKVFDAFFKGTTRSRGNGLGMFVARKGAERLGGKLDLVSPKKPTVFRMVLPLVSPDVMTAERVEAG